MTAATTTFRWREPSILPGFGLALGITVAALSLIVLIPLAALFLKAASAGPADIWAVATSPRTLAAPKGSANPRCRCDPWPRGSLNCSGAR